MHYFGPLKVKFAFVWRLWARITTNVKKEVRHEKTHCHSNPAAIRNPAAVPYSPVDGDMPPRDDNKVFWHYTSSSPDPNENNNPNILWAEEGASRGSFSTSVSEDFNGNLYSYRCIRNLGIPLDQPGTEPEDLVQVFDNGDGSYTIDLSRMNPKIPAFLNGRRSAPPVR